MKYEKRKRHLTITKIMVFLIVLIIGFGSAIWVNNNLQQKAIHEFEVLAMAHHLNHREVGDLQSYQEANSHYVAAIYYPVFNKSGVDSLIKETLDSHYEEFKKQYGNESPDDIFKRAIFNIGYNSYALNERFVSLYFQINTQSPSLAHLDSISFTMLLDLETDTVITSDDYFKEGYLEVLKNEAQQFFNEDSKLKTLMETDKYQTGFNDDSNFKNILLEKDRLSLVFEKYSLFSGDVGEVVVPIDYSVLEEVFVYDLVGEEIVIEIPEPHNRKLLAFTFDDGPSRLHTKRIVDAFEKVNGKATFFMLGLQLEIYPEQAQYVAQKGHQLGNHTYSHPDLTRISVEEVIMEIEKTNQLIFDVTGVHSTVVRPTYGLVNEASSAAIKYPLIHWNLDSIDWKSRDKNAVIDSVMRDVKDNSIIIMHDIYESTAEAVEYLLPVLANQGYEFVTIDELARLNGVQLEASELYRFIE